MRLSGIRTRAEGALKLGATLAAIRKGPGCDVQMVNAVKPMFLAAVADQITRPMILVCSDEARASELVQDIQTWACNADVMSLPDPDQPVYSQMAVSHTILNQRVSVLARLANSCASKSQMKNIVVVVSVPSLLRRLIPPDEFRRQFLTLRAGLEVSPQDLARRLANLGYQRTPLVEAPGEFASRGGIVDLFPPDCDRPIRIDFFGDLVESLSYFSSNSQRSEDPCPEIHLCPASEVPVWLGQEIASELRLINIDEMRAEDKETWLRHMSDLENRVYFDSAAFYTMSAMTEAANLLDYSPNAVVAVDEFDSVRWGIAENERIAAENRSKQILDGELPGDIGSPVFSADDIATALASAAIRVSHASAIPDGSSRREEFVVEGFGQPPLYSGRLAVLISDLEQRRASGKTTVLASHQGRRLCDLLNERGLGAVMLDDIDAVNQGEIGISTPALSGGWEVNDLNLQVLSDVEIFGTSRTQPKPRRRQAIDRTFLSDLKPGDYVVHIDHGIGKFEGIMRISEIGGDREYLLLRYAADDKLYVPIDQLGRVQRYIAMGDFSPRLSRLGGGDWNKAKQRARSSARDIAGELLEIYAAREIASGHQFPADSSWQRAMEEKFPYIETPDQEQAISDVKADMEGKFPMDRLVCGDVGYGKTEVAIRAAFKAAMDGKQVAILVPTTILAQQHLDTFRQRMGEFPLRIEALSRFRSAVEQADVVRKVGDGGVDIVIGTHRLIQKDVKFANLGLVIIDEEQRFGVADKERLKKFRKEVDVLTLTATPIPRTLHMALVGVRGISIMESPPLERQAVKTYVTGYSEDVVRRAILSETDRGGQVYFVHNRVQSIEATAARLRHLIPEATFVVAHGQMPSTKLERLMVDFAGGNADVLVCTAIIENGMDLPNVNTLIADECWMFGLAQLYQLRGRVGRSANQAYAYFLYSPERRLTEEAQKRLQAIMEASELGAGFRLAMRDLEIRGAGDLLGAEQHGFANAVGFDLYCRMLADAVKNAKGEPADELVPPIAEIGLPLDAYLPDDFMTGYETKIREYQHLAKAISLSEVEAVIASLRDRFGVFPQAVENLAYVIRIRAKATVLGIESITSYGDEMLIRFPKDLVVRRRIIRDTVGRGMKLTRNGLSWSGFQNDSGWQAKLNALLDAIADRAATSSGRRPALTGELVVNPSSEYYQQAEE